MRILIADNDQPFLMLLQTFLQEQGYEVEIADDAIDCLGRLRAFLPDVLILGRLLWGGAEGVVEAIDDENQLNRIPIILLQESPKSSRLHKSKHLIVQLQRPIRLGSLAKEIARLQLCQTNGSLSKYSFITFCETLNKCLPGLEHSNTHQTISHSAG